MTNLKKMWKVKLSIRLLKFILPFIMILGFDWVTVRGNRTPFSFRINILIFKLMVNYFELGGD